MPLKEIVASNIAQRRTNLGWSQRFLAKKAHISYSYVSLIESGKRSATMKAITLISKAFRVHPSKLAM